MNHYPYYRGSQGSRPPLTNQVPYLNQYSHNHGEERWGFLPLLGGLALGGLIFGGGCNGRPCGGYYPPYPPYPMYPPYPSTYYPQPVYPQPGYYPYQPYSQVATNQATVVESNKFYVN